MDCLFCLISVSVNLCICVSQLLCVSVSWSLSTFASFYFQAPTSLSLHTVLCFQASVSGLQNSIRFFSLDTVCCLCYSSYCSLCLSVCISLLLKAPGLFDHSCCTWLLTLMLHRALQWLLHPCQQEC